jgi:Zn-dependent protease
MVWVALAGPGANLVQAFFWMAVYFTLQSNEVQEHFWLEMARGGLIVNLVMFAFNLFPLPPLDGGRVLVGLLPMPAARALSRVEPFGFFVVLALVMGITETGLAWLLTPLR